MLEVDSIEARWGKKKKKEIAAEPKSWSLQGNRDADWLLYNHGHIYEPSKRTFSVFVQSNLCNVIAVYSDIHIPLLCICIAQWNCMHITGLGKKYCSATK